MGIFVIITGAIVSYFIVGFILAVVFVKNEERNEEDILIRSVVIIMWPVIVALVAIVTLFCFPGWLAQQTRHFLLGLTKKDP